MADYKGSTVPIGNKKVQEFTTKLNGTPVVPATVTVEWRNHLGVLLETDTLAGGGVTTASTATGHYKADVQLTAGANVVVAAGYECRVSWTAQDGSGPYAESKSFDVVASAQDVQFTAPNLCTVGDVKDELATIGGLALPAGATEPRIEAVIEQEHEVVLQRYNVDAFDDLTDQQKVVGKAACIALVVARLLLSFRPQSESAGRVASEYRKRANDILDNLRPKGATGSRRRIRSRVSSFQPEDS